MHATALIDAFNEALAEEIAYLRNEGGRPLVVLDGVLVYRGQEGFLYAFELEVDAFLLDGTPVRLRYGSRETGGEVVTVRGSELTLALHENMGELLERAEVLCEPWFLLTALQERLRETPERNLRMAMAVLEKVPARRRSFVSLSAAAGAQDEALRLAGEREITFIWGPPGTGKTETLALIAKLFFEQGGRVLILSHANVAVDGAVLRAAARIGAPARSGLVARYGWARLPELRQSGLQASSQAAAGRPEMQERLRELEDERSELLAGLRAGGARGGRLTEVEQALRDIREALKEAAAHVCRAARVVGCTLSTAANDPVIYNEHYDFVLLDEASMAYIPQVFFAASLAGKKLVVSGDFRQLAPVALAGTPEVKRWLRRDIFEEAGITSTFENGQAPDIAVLRLQRRMHPSIAGFVNDFVYGGLLYNAPETSGRAALAAAGPCPGAALTLVDLSELPAFCYRHGSSRFNPLSAFLALTLAGQIRPGGLTVGLLTPYAAQARLLNALTAGFLGVTGARSEAAGLVAATVHRFQGAEQDAVVLDLVDSFPQRGPGGLLSRREGSAGQRLINVAVTRARGKLFVLACRDFLESRLPGDSAVCGLFRFIRENGRVIGGKELLANLPVHVTGEEMEIEWHAGRRPAMEAWEADVRHAASVQVDWPAAAGPPERLVVNALRRARAGGARLSLRAGRPSLFPPDLQPYAIKYTAAHTPLTAVDRDIFWYGSPWPGDDKVDRCSVRVAGEKVCRNLIYLLEMDLRGGFYRGRYAGLKAYVENRFTCPRCGAPLTVRSGTGGGHFLGCTAYPRCDLPVDKLTLEIIEDYLIAAGLTCPAGHLLKTVPSKHGPLAICSHNPACRCVYQVRDLL
ncbi:AAA domain-containing protein [Pelotomaculum isophthalicicum JI]|uniref:AAA domain-containing protein n=1 Tax=Pelotomaculum isophthalicicum JI TaxID=947010 RepID=A0A9X4GZ41_9FIRM|nr:AAA domain-containing protein [Pelotomaculum isophthalicicum]MDF9408345.1 AAA domain-containing protein [Pelotomaculum isophthalicicum JI]